jgi:hypothetical protein
MAPLWSYDVDEFLTKRPKLDKYGNGNADGNVKMKVNASMKYGIATIHSK